MLVGALMCQGGLAFAKDFDIEDEGNNSRRDADTISVYEDKRVTVGTINEDDKHDYFEFVAKRDGEMDVFVKFDDRYASKDLDIDIYITQASGTPIDKDSNSDGRSKFSFPVTSGESYYVHINCDEGFLDEPYWIEYDIDQVQ